MSTTLFLKELAKNWREIGAVAPSSVFLTEKMLSVIDFASACTVVELGAGTGVMTREMLKRLSSKGTLTVFELNKNFCNALRKEKDARLSVHCLSAEKLHAMLPESSVDVVLSGLPLLVLPKERVRSILEAIQKTLSPKGVFVQFQYSLASRKLLLRHFQTVDVYFVSRNIPPAFVYVCSSGTPSRKRRSFHNIFERQNT